MKKLSLIAVALLLTACGGSDDGYDSGGGNNPLPPPVVAPPVSTVDAFFSRVQAFVASQSETDDPGDIAAVVATAPEDTEPVPL